MHNFKRIIIYLVALLYIHQVIGTDDNGESRPNRSAVLSLSAAAGCTVVGALLLKDLWNNGFCLGRFALTCGFALGAVGSVSRVARYQHNKLILRNHKHMVPVKTLARVERYTFGIGATLISAGMSYLAFNHSSRLALHEHDFEAARYKDYGIVGTALTGVAASYLLDKSLNELD